MPSLPAGVNDAIVSFLQKLYDYLSASYLHVIFLVLLYFVLHAGYGWLVKHLEKKRSLSARNVTLMKPVVKFIKLVILFIVILFLLEKEGVNIHSLVTFISILGASLVLAFSNTLSNIASAFITILYGVVRPGDWVLYNNEDTTQITQIKELRLFFIETSFMGTRYFLPYSEVSSGKILQLMDGDVIHLKRQIYLDQDSDPRKFMSLLVERLRNHPDLALVEDPVVYIASITERGYEFLCFIALPFDPALSHLIFFEVVDDVVQELGYRYPVLV